MKVISDKIDAAPFHAISRGDVRLIFSAVPPSWSELVGTVRLSGSLKSWPALYNATDKIFTIASRGRTKEETVRLVIAELASHALGFRRRTFQHLQARYKSQVDALIEPILAELLPKL